MKRNETKEQEGKKLSLIFGTSLLLAQAKNKILIFCFVFLLPVTISQSKSHNCISHVQRSPRLTYTWQGHNKAASITCSRSPDKMKSVCVFGGMGGGQRCRDYSHCPSYFLIYLILIQIVQILTGITSGSKAVHCHSKPH